MGKLSASEQQQLEALQAKQRAPDEAPVGKSARFNVDLGDSAQVALAKKLGLIPSDDDDGGDDGGKSDDDEDDVPGRTGYFSKRGKK